MTLAASVAELLREHAELRPFAEALAAESERLRDELIAPTDVSTEALTLELLRAHLPVLSAMAQPSGGKGSAMLSAVIAKSVENWRVVSLEIFEHLATDRAEIENHFGKLGLFKSISAPSGDFHRGGRTVRILAFDTGSKLVYKPRSLRIDAAFQNFVAWINAQGLSKPLRVLKLLDRGEYGWSEFVEAAPCEVAQDAKDFDFRMGALLAVFHLLGGTDMHFQNILAAGAQPMAIDLETLFHRFPRHTEADVATASSKVYLEILNSVLSVGILSWPIPVGPAMYLDMGALGGKFHPPGLQSRATASNRPVVQGEIQEVDLASVTAGFDEASRILIAHKRELPLADFSSAKVRVVIQGTFVYQQNLLRSYELAALSSPEAREKYFDECFESGPPGVRQFAESEKAQLLNGDIPFFDVEVDGDEMVGADGRRFPNVAGQNGWRTTQERAARLSLEELEKQLWFLNATYGFAEAGSLRFAEAVSLDDARTTIARRLAKQAIPLGATVSWPSFRRLEQIPDEKIFEVVPATASEAAWLALFFADKNPELALAAFNTCEELTEDRLEPLLTEANAVALLALHEAKALPNSYVSSFRQGASSPATAVGLLLVGEAALARAAFDVGAAVTNASALASVRLARRFPDLEQEMHRQLRVLVDRADDDLGFVHGMSGALHVLREAGAKEAELLETRLLKLLRERGLREFGLGLASFGYAGSGSSDNALFIL